jgi:hypothetical protein
MVALVRTSMGMFQRGLEQESTNNRMDVDGGIGEDLNGDVPERIGAREKTSELSVCFVG